MRAKYGDRFLFLVSVPALAAKWFVYERQGRKLTPDDEKYIEDKARAYARVGDGILLCEAHMLGKLENGERAFADGYWEEMHRIAAKVLDEPEFRGRKLLGSAGVVAHLNAYRGGHDIAEDGTRTLRRSLETAICYNADYIMLPEWDEFNENTCFMPTLYSSYTVKRILRHLLGRLKGCDWGVLPGDDVTKPNLIVSYRKSLTPGEALTVEVLNVPDGSRQGVLRAWVELVNEHGETLRRFAPAVLDETKLDEVRFQASTAELAPSARAIQVRLFWEKDGKRGAVESGLHFVDLVPGGEWNHLCVRQPVRDLVMPETADVSVGDGRLRATLRCDEPIRYAMLCGNGCIQAIRGKQNCDADRFREDDDFAVFQLTVLTCSGKEIRTKQGSPFVYEVPGIDAAEWHYMKDVTKGTRFTHLVECAQGYSPSVYLRLPKARLKDVVLAYDFPGISKGTVSLAEAHRLGAYAHADERAGLSLTVARFGLQDRYPSVADANEVTFDLPLAADRASMAYHVQLVTMRGKTWFSRPFVVEKNGMTKKMNVWDVVFGKVADIALPAARVPMLVYDFSPQAGGVVRPASAEQHWFGMLGTSYTQATLWNRGCRTEGAIPWSNDFYAREDRIGVPRRAQEADGSWSLVFDGKDDYVGFPWTTLPSFGGFAVDFDICPDRLPEKGTRAFVFGSREILFGLMLESDGTLSLKYIEMFGSAECRTKLKLTPGVWAHLRLVCDGRQLTLAVGDRLSQPLTVGDRLSQPLTVGDRLSQPLAVGDRLSQPLTVGDRLSQPLAVQLPGRGTTPVVLGGYPDKSAGFFAGRIRNLVIDHGRAFAE